MSKVFLLLSAVAVSVVGTVLFSQTTKALSFEPGYIISDSIFTNSTSMSANSIQNFITQKGASCTNGEAPCLKNYIENGKSAGTIIAEAAQANSINPQVLLATLQKETGLVTLSQPGAWRYRTAMGYACPDSTPGVCDSRYLGFTNQVNMAATMFRRIMSYDPNWYTPYQVGVNYIGFNPSSSCGGTNVTIQNRATAALYSYTPYQPNAAALAAGYGEGNSCSAYGNRNFWLYFNNWFGSSISSILIQSPQSQAVYLQSGNTRFGIPSWDVIDAYDFDRFGVTAVSDTYMNSLADGGVLSTVFSNKAFPGPIYLADNGYRFGFSSYQQCVDWGFPSCTSSSFAKALEPSVFDRLYVYGDMTPLMLNGAHVHLMKNGQKQTFLSNQARIESGYGSTPYVPITNPLNIAQPYDNSIPENNSFVSFKGNSAIYAYTGGLFYPLSYNAYRSLSTPATPVVYDDFSKYTQAAPAANQFVTPYLRLADGKTYALTADKKIDITAVTSDWPAAQQINDLKVIADRKSTDYTANGSSTYRTISGGIVKLESKNWREYYSLTDYFNLGNSNPIPISDATINDFQKGSTVLSAGYGTLFQTGETGKENAIFTLSNDGTTCQIYSLPQLGLYKLDASNVRRINLSTGQANLLSTTTYDENGNVHIVYNGVHSSISASSLISTWGIQSRMNICTFKAQQLSKNPVNQAAPQFVRNEHTGIIYLGENGKKRPIYSYQAFLRMGGNSINTQDVSMEFLVTSPDGTPIYE